MGMVIPLRPGRAMAPPAPTWPARSAPARPARGEPSAESPAESPLADRVAAFCRARLLEPGAVAVSLETIAYQLDLDRATVQGAVEQLERQQRITLRPFSLRSRPHVVIQAVCGIDDVVARPGGQQER